MNSAQFSIAKLMVVVGVVALNLGAGRLILEFGPPLLLVIAPAGLAAQFFLFRLIRTRGRRRAFWAGLVAGGLPLTVCSFLWGFVFGGSTGIGVDPSTGQRIVVRTPGVAGSAQVRTIWAKYQQFAERTLNTIAKSWNMERAAPGPSPGSFVFEIVVGMAGGMLALCIIWPRAPPAASSSGHPQFRIESILALGDRS